MQPAPELYVIAVVADLDAFSGFMTTGLGAAHPVRMRHAELHGDLYGLSSGHLLALQPTHADTPCARFLAERGPGFMAFGTTAAGLPGSTGDTLCANGPLSGIVLTALPRTGIQIATNCPGNRTASPNLIQIALDHVAYVVGNLDDAVSETQAVIGVGEPAALGRWHFPDFEITNAVVLFDRAYVEFNKPGSTEGLFGGLYARHKAGAAFICLRSENVQQSRDGLARRGIVLGEPLVVTALRPGDNEPRALGTVYDIPRRATQGLRIMLFETSWPWNFL